MDGKQPVKALIKFACPDELLAGISRSRQAWPPGPPPPKYSESRRRGVTVRARRPKTQNPRATGAGVRDTLEDATEVQIFSLTFRTCRPRYMTVFRRPESRRVGKERVSTCRYRRAP